MKGVTRLRFRAGPCRRLWQSRQRSRGARCRVTGVRDVAGVVPRRRALAPCPCGVNWGREERSEPRFHAGLLGAAPTAGLSPRSRAPRSGAWRRCPWAGGTGIVFFAGLGEGWRVKTPFLDTTAVQKRAFLRAGTFRVSGESVK